MKWKNNTEKFSLGESLFLGPWNVAGFHYDSCRSRNDPLKYAATCKLPGIKSHLGWFEESEQARSVVEKAVAHWLNKLTSNAGIERR